MPHQTQRQVIVRIVLALVLSIFFGTLLVSVLLVYTDPMEEQRFDFSAGQPLMEGGDW